MGFLSDRMFSMFDSMLDSCFTNVINKITYDKLKSRLKKSVQEKFLNKYGNRDFFDKLDAFLEQNNIIDEFIVQCYNQQKCQYRNSDELINTICERFKNNCPEYIYERASINTALLELYNIIFKTLNDIEESNEARIIINCITKDISKRDAIINIKLDKLEKKSSFCKNDKLSNNEPPNSYVLEKAKEINKYFVRTTAYKKGLTAFSNKNIVVLTGNSGIGKSDTSIMLASYFAQEYEPKYIDGIDKDGSNNIKALLELLEKDFKKKEIIIFDDFLGKTKLDESETFLAAIEEFFKIAKGFSNKKFVLNARKTMIESVKIRKDSIAYFLNFDVYMIDLDYWDDINDCINIFIEYTKKNNIMDFDALLSDKKIIESILKHPNFSPLIIDRATQNCKSQLPEKYGDIILTLLENPSFIWNKEIEALNSHSFNYLTILYSLSDTFVSKETVDNCYMHFVDRMSIEQDESLVDTIERLNALVSYNNQKQITFRHPSIIDYLHRKISEQKKKDIISTAKYFEQIERLDCNKVKIKNLLASLDFFDLKVLPITFKFENTDHNHEFQNSIHLKYLKYIFELDIRDRDYEYYIIMALDEVFKCGRLLLIHSSDIIINVLCLDYNFSQIICNEKYMELLYGCSLSTNIWKLIELTVEKDDQGYDFQKMKSYVQDEISLKLGEIASDGVSDFIETVFDEYLYDYIDDYKIDDDYEYMAQEIIDIIRDETEAVEAGENAMQMTTEKYKIYNIDLNEVEFADSTWIFNFAINRIEELEPY